MLDLDVEHTKRKDPDCHIESQPTASSDKDTKYQDLKRINRSDTRNSHWPFVDTRSNVVEVGEARKTLFQSTVVTTTSSMTPETKPCKKQRTNLDLEGVGSPLL